MSGARISLPLENDAVDLRTKDARFYGAQRRGTPLK